MKDNEKLDLTNTIDNEYKAIANQLFFIQSLWNNYKTLFGFTKERFDFLAKKNYIFFDQVEFVFYRYLILSIAKIFDPLESKKGNKNCSIKALEASFKNIDETKKVELQKIYSDKSITKIIKKIKSIRNKIIAHSDYETYTKNKKFNRIPRTEIKEIIAVLREYLIKVHSFLNINSELLFDEETLPPIGAESILFSLLKEERYDELRKNLEFDDLEKNAKSYKSVFDKKD